MAVSATRGSVTNSAPLLLASVASAPDGVDIPPGQGLDVFLRCAAGTAVLGGGTTVKSYNGYSLVPTQPLNINLDYGESLYAIRPTSGTTTVHVLTSTRD